MLKKNGKKVLMICTGGTIGMLHKVKDDPTTPLVPATWAQIEDNFIAMKDLPFDVDAEEMELIDSSDMHPGYWQKIAYKIQEKYDNYDGFVILHGTDTMAYTATALSFFFENLGKPVIVTGSQLPLAKPRSDAAQNLVTALTIAASQGVPTIPEVCIFFDKKLLRGNRSRKVSSTGFDGFDSPNFPPLAVIGEHIKVNEKIIRKIPKDPFFINPSLNPNVMIFEMFPGIQSTNIPRSVFDINKDEKEDKKLKGIIMKAFGTGNVPTKKEFLNEIEYATQKRQLAVVNITQCNQGMVEMGLYDASAGLIRRGVLSGVDMTSEAALVKMMVLLGQGYKDETFKEQMQRNLRGEQSYNVYNFIYDRRQGTEEQNTCHLDEQTIPAGFVRDKIVTATIRFDEATVDKVEKELEPLNVAIFMNYPVANANTPTTIPQCLGVIENVKTGTDFMLPCAQKVSQVINPAIPLKLTVVSQNGNISWNGMVLSIYTDVDE